MGNCPFGECKDIVCDFMGVKHEGPVIQCPTQIFNKCQGDIKFQEEDMPIIENTLKDLERIKNK